jgi:hypothetical protein
MNICPYLDEVAALVEAEYREMWNEFGSEDYRLDQMNRVQLDLLRRTEALRGPYATRILDLGQEVAEQLDVATVPFFLHQPQGSRTTVPRLCFQTDEVHLVVSPEELARLSDEQIRAVLAHEVTHYVLWTVENGRYRNAELLLAALAADSRLSTSLQTERNYRRFAELVCDRGALRVEPELETLATAMWELTPRDEEQESPSLESVTTGAGPPSQHGTHPSWAMRCWAAARWLDLAEKCEDDVRRAVVGQMSMDQLCLVDQRELRKWSHWILSRLTEPSWMQTPAVTGHVRLFFPDGVQQGEPAQDSIVSVLNEVEDDGIRDYLSYLTLDIATVDRNLEHYPVAWALEVWGSVDWSDHVRDVVGRELKMGKRQLQQMRRERAEILAEAAGKHSPS